jgi:epoxyqueuosine reductase QueG
VGLRRNLAVAIGNTGDAAALSALDEGTPDRVSVADPMVQEHVAWARGVRRPPDANGGAGPSR